MALIDNELNRRNFMRTPDTDAHLSPEERALRDAAHLLDNHGHPDLARSVWDRFETVTDEGEL